MNIERQLLDICKINVPCYWLDSFEGNNIYIFREDLIPYSFGGNKVIIGIKYFEDMKKKDCDCMVAYGRPQSNLCRVLSSICKKSNIPYHILAPVHEDDKESLNSKIAEMMNAQIHMCERQSISDEIRETINKLRLQGLKPYYIYGNEFGVGNEDVPVSAYVERYINMIHANVVQYSINDIVLPLGTGMTMAGIARGADYCRDVIDIIGISVARKVETAYEYYTKYFNSYHGENSGNDDVKRIILDDYILDGYGTFNNDEEGTIYEAFYKYGIPLDPTYVGKAYWGMRRWIRSEGISGKNILFIHTGGVPIWFDYILERK